ncbi:uncharacterized protein TrAtP1_007842 [Trichoderma atroviride]|uniref:uncharacterized protein n=1 Tax=Hypocrea atroviridis TaxID=63577 RepID=UPI00331B5D7B|nr:hypothetical protein TrAtP1_007842 [Trichoderma atroviride]
MTRTHSHHIITSSTRGSRPLNCTLATELRDFDMQAQSTACSRGNVAFARLEQGIRRCWSIRHFVQFPFRIPRRSPSMCSPPIFFARWLANLLLVDAKENPQRLKRELTLLKHSPGILQALSPDFVSVSVGESGNREARLYDGREKILVEGGKIDIIYCCCVVSIRKDRETMEC